MRRGEVYWAVLAPRTGSEQSGRRPVVIVSHDGFNEVPSWRSIIVVPISTSKSQARRSPTTVVLPAGVAGLTSESVVLCHQITTLDRTKLDKRLGELTLKDLRRVEDGLLKALDIIRE